MYNETQYAREGAGGAAAFNNARPFCEPVAEPKSPSCSACTMRSVCMPVELSLRELAKLDALIHAKRKVKTGEALYRADDKFQSIYAVRTGSFKTVIRMADGREQVTGFQLLGETLGFDGVCTGQHNCDAIALEDSYVCIIPFSLLEEMCRATEVMQRHVHRMMSSEIVRESQIMMLLGTMNAEQRVAAFLLNLSQRMKRRGYSGAEFNLRMTREEMGSYLGMKLETVSRMLSKFRRDGIVHACEKQIRIVDFDRLSRV
jgi:CRP/FNR family transcriptional regulator